MRTRMSPYKNKSCGAWKTIFWFIVSISMHFLSGSVVFEGYSYVAAVSEQINLQRNLYKKIFLWVLRLFHLKDFNQWFEASNVVYSINSHRIQWKGFHWKWPAKKELFKIFYVPHLRRLCDPSSYKEPIKNTTPAFFIRLPLFFVIVQRILSVIESSTVH